MKADRAKAVRGEEVWSGRRRRIHMREVGPRDGLQNEGVFVPTADKIALVDAPSDAGLAKIEVTAFVSPKAIPALADAEAVLTGSAAGPARCMGRWCRTCAARSAPWKRGRRSRVS